MYIRVATISLILGITLSGCFEAGDKPESDGGPGADSGLPAADSGLPQPSLDAGVLAPGCQYRAIDGYSDTGLLPNTPTSIPVFIDECSCGNEITCTVDVVGDVVQLSTQLCSDPTVDCDACGTHSEGTCEIPALPEGEYAVFSNGEAAAQLIVSPGGQPPTTTSLAHQDNACGSGGETNRAELDELCTRYDAVNRRIAFTVTADCESCVDSLGTCEVLQEGSVLYVDAIMESGTCEIGCPAVCEPREMTCWSPPLDPGDYHVQIGITSIFDDITISDANADVPEQCVRDLSAS